MGPEDEIEVVVWFHNELNAKLTIRPDGMITFPLAGELRAAGLTPTQLADEISKRISKYLVESQVSVIVIKANSRKFTILGQVRAPGQYIIMGESNILNLISHAGGITEDAKLSQSILLRGKDKVIKLDLRGLLFEGNLNDNIALLPLDTLIIPENLEDQFYVLGEVNQPGVYKLKEGETITIRKALGGAGGLKQYVTLKTANILKPDNKTIFVDLYKLFILNDSTQDIMVQAGDVIFVPKVIGNEIFVLGEVRKPGVYELEGEITVLKGVSLAGGYTEDAVIKNAKVIRGQLDNPEIISVDLEKLLKKGDIKDNILLKPGDIVFVPESISADVNYVLSKILSPLQLILSSAQLIYFTEALNR